MCRFFISLIIVDLEVLYVVVFGSLCMLVMLVMLISVLLGCLGLVCVSIGVMNGWNVLSMFI